MPKHRTAITPLQQQFINEYLVDMNGAEAVRRAGFTTANPDVYAYQLLRKPLVKAAIAQAMEKRAEKTKINSQWVLEQAVTMLLELREANKLDASKLYGKDGNLLPIHKWPKQWREKQNVQRLEVVETFRTNAKKQKVFSGYIKKLGATDHKALEGVLLKIIGQHTDVAAFTQPEEASAPRDVKVVVVFQDMLAEKQKALKA